jgi:uncharacterized caspase-like protein/sRNA-binding protein
MIAILLIFKYKNPGFANEGNVSMQTISMRIFLVLFFLFLINPSSLIAATERRIALVIGNSAYTSAPLKNPVNDATAMATQLQKLGFTVVLKKNANLRVMEDAIIDFGDRLKRGGVGLFFYAGHGLQVGGGNYLIPIGAKINRESDIKYETLDAGKILDEMANANNGLNIVILDACRDNPYSRSFRNAARGLAIVSNAPAGTFISYSTSPGTVAKDGDGRHSPYAEALLRYMKEPGLTIEQVFKSVRAKLGKETGGKQIPWELSSLQGEFYFAPGSAGKSAATVPSGKVAVARDESSVSMPSVTDEMDDENHKLEAEQRRLEEEKASFAKKALEEKRQKIAEERERLAAEQEEERQAAVKRKSEAKRKKSTVAAVASLSGGEIDDPVIKEKRELLQKMADELNKQRPILKETVIQMKEAQYAAKKAEYDRLVLAMGSRPSISTSVNEIKRDSRFIAYDNGTVLDTRTNLMWAARDNGKHINWANAKSYCENYSGGGYSDWRMPTQDELAGLYDAASTYKSDCGYDLHLTKLIRLTCLWVFASETRDSQVADFGFDNGTRYWHPTSNEYILHRVLPVRSGK